MEIMEVQRKLHRDKMNRLSICVIKKYKDTNVYNMLNV
jgi:hypothetical protein